MGWLVQFFKSSVGAKVMMALTGVALVGFVLGHLAGNLQVFVGRETFNAYAYFLKSKPGLLWAVRLGVLASAPIN